MFIFCSLDNYINRGMTFKKASQFMEQNDFKKIHANSYTLKIFSVDTNYIVIN